MCNVFYHNSIAGNLSSLFSSKYLKYLNPIVEATKLDEWLYGSNFTEQIKEWRTIEKICASQLEMS